MVEIEDMHDFGGGIVCLRCGVPFDMKTVQTPCLALRADDLCATVDSELPAATPAIIGTATIEVTQENKHVWHAANNMCRYCGIPFTSRAALEPCTVHGAMSDVPKNTARQNNLRTEIDNSLPANCVPVPDNLKFFNTDTHLIDGVPYRPVPLPIWHNVVKAAQAVQRVLSGRNLAGNNSLLLGGYEWNAGDATALANVVRFCRCVTGLGECSPYPTNIDELEKFLLDNPYVLVDTGQIRDSGLYSFRGVAIFEALTFQSDIRMIHCPYPSTKIDYYTYDLQFLETGFVSVQVEDGSGLTIRRHFYYTKIEG